MCSSDLDQALQAWRAPPRTRLSKPGEPRQGSGSPSLASPAKDQALQAWRASRGTSPREGIIDAASNSAKDQAEPRKAPWPHEGSFHKKPSLPPRQSAHGLCVSARGDARAAVAVLVYKAVNKAAPSKGGSQLRHFRDKEATCTADVTVGCPHGPLQRQPPPSLDGGFSALGTLPPAPQVRRDMSPPYR